MQMETPSQVSPQVDARQMDVRQMEARRAPLLVVIVLLALAAGLLVAQRVQGSAQTNMQADIQPVSQHQVFGTVPPVPTPGPPSNLLAYMPIVFNNPNVVTPPDVQP